MTHEYTTISTAEARKMHPAAAIIRQVLGKTIVFDETSDAMGHSSAAVQPAKA